MDILAESLVSSIDNFDLITLFLYLILFIHPLYPHTSALFSPYYLELLYNF